MKKNNKKNSIFFYILIVLLILQILSLNWIFAIKEKSKSTINSINRDLVTNDNILVNDIVRPQQRFIADSIKQSWMKYIEDTKTSLIKENHEGKPIYSNETRSIPFDKNTMYRNKVGNNKYDIYSKENKMLLLTDCKPEWDIYHVQQILNFLVAPVKSFGNDGGIIVFDSNTGKIFLDTTPANRKEKEPNLSIFEDYKNKLNKNPIQTKREINNFITKKDSNRLSSFVYSFNESKQMGNNVLNFKEYPLGQYDRLFVEKLVLPYETFGFDGQPMQLTMLIMSDEQDISKAYKENDLSIDENIKTMNEILERTTLILFISTIITMIVILIAVYIIKYSSDEKMIRE